MNILNPFAKAESQPDTVEAPRGVQLEVAPVAAERWHTVSNGVSRVMSLAANVLGAPVPPRQLTGLERAVQSDVQPGGAYADGIAAANRSARQFAENQDLIDPQLRYAQAEPGSVAYDPVAEAEEITRNAAMMRQQERTVADVPRSEYDMPVEATAYGPQVPKEVSDASRLYDDTLNPAALDQEAIRAQIQEAYRA